MGRPQAGARPLPRQTSKEASLSTGTDLPVVELLWFRDCPHHAAARLLLLAVIDEVAPGTRVEIIDASDPAVAGALRFPGSPTIRIDGRDVDPGYVDPGDYSPRCRLYRTAAGLRGLPERRWIAHALRAPAQPPGADSA